MRLLAPLALSLLAVPAAAQQAADEACVAAGACRVLGDLAVEGPDGTTQTFAMGMVMPWLEQGNLMLAPGDTVILALDEVDGVLVPRLIAAGEASRDVELREGQIRFDLSRIQRGQLILSVLSFYPEPLDYGALKVSLGLGPERTSVCTLQPGLSVFEAWQEPIYQMALFGFRPASEAACHIIDEDAELADDTAAG